MLKFKNQTMVQKAVKDQITILQSLAHPVRLQIMLHLHRKKVSNVQNIYRNLELEQSITSQHLKTLREADLIKSKREGRNIYYSINYPILKNALKGIEKMFLGK